MEESYEQSAIIQEDEEGDEELSKNDLLTCSAGNTPSMFDQGVSMDKTAQHNEFEDTTGGTSGQEMIMPMMREAVAHESM